MTVRHVGLCSHSGPNEMDGQIKLRFTDATSKIAATLWFDGHQCTYPADAKPRSVSWSVPASGSFQHLAEIKVHAAISFITVP